ncbi:hypothetical protein VE00_09602, partial [Pseudogymnoascus sp. WSF 3629]
MITSIAHVNLTVPAGTFSQAEAFYANTLGMKRVPVPMDQKDILAWFDITPGGQQIHIAFDMPNDAKAMRHPCFKLESPEALEKLQRKVWRHFEMRTESEGAPLEVDRPGEADS